MPSIQEFVLFKDCMWMGNIPELDFDQLVEFANDVYYHDLDGRRQSNRGGYQSHDVFAGEHKFKNHNEFNRLMSCMSNAVQTGVKNSYDKDVIITPGNSWVNINHPGDFNTMHSHPACVFSSVVYLTDNNSPIMFADINTARSSYVAFTKSTDIFLVDVSFFPKKGDYFIFPSWTPHMVEPATDKRITISTNFHLEV